MEKNIYTVYTDMIYWGDNATDWGLMQHSAFDAYILPGESASFSAGF